MDIMRPSLRGIFSATQISRQLGAPIYTFGALRLALTG